MVHIDYELKCAFDKMNSHLIIIITHMYVCLFF